MDAVRARKAKKVLYLYLTIPLLILTAVFGMIALMTHVKKSKPPEPAFKARPVGVSVHADAGLESPGSAWSESRPSVELPPLDDDGDSLADESTDDDQDDEVDSPKESTAGTAAIVTALMGGLTGLVGAMTQTFIAFMKMRDKRRPEPDEEESSDDQEQS
jgi:hypothetical protein